MTGNDNVLVTGATGYVGGRLVPRLLSAGYRVRVLVRDPRRLQGRTWLAQVDVAQGDVLDPATLPADRLDRSHRDATLERDRQIPSRYSEPRRISCAKYQCP